MAWLPFGAGPRQCIGMRLASVEMKIAMAKLLQKFTIEKCHKTVGIDTASFSFKAGIVGVQKK